MHHALIFRYGAHMSMSIYCTSCGHNPRGTLPSQMSDGSYTVVLQRQLIDGDDKPFTRTSTEKRTEIIPLKPQIKLIGRRYAIICLNTRKTQNNESLLFL